MKPKADTKCRALGPVHEAGVASVLFRRLTIKKGKLCEAKAFGLERWL